MNGDWRQKPIPNRFTLRSSNKKPYPCEYPIGRTQLDFLRYQPNHPLIKLKIDFELFSLWELLIVSIFRAYFQNPPFENQECWISLVFFEKLAMLNFPYYWTFPPICFFLIFGSFPISAIKNRRCSPWGCLDFRVRDFERSYISSLVCFCKQVKLIIISVKRFLVGLSYRPSMGSSQTSFRWWICVPWHRRWWPSPRIHL